MLISHYQTFFKNWELHIEEQIGDAVRFGTLRSSVDPTVVYPIRDYIPRFCDASNYTDNFGLQWNRFKSTQLDSRNGKKLSHTRFYQFTGWKPRDLFGKRVLEVGCGAGRFTEILLEAGAEVVSFDLSAAVDACYENNKDPHLLVFQGSLFELPLAEDSFDFVFSFGVLQHTPDPLAAFRTIVRYAKKDGGKVAIDNYIRRLLSPFSTPKYIWRPLTSRMPPELLLKIVRAYIPLYLPFDSLVRRVPLVGSRLLALIPVPCWNYIGLGLSRKERLEWAILDTFDALAPKYDIPLELPDFEVLCRESGLQAFEVFYGSNGLVVRATR